LGCRLLYRLRVSPEVVDTLEKGDIVEIDLERGVVKSARGIFEFPPLPEAVIGIFEAGGLIPYTRKRLGLE